MAIPTQVKINDIWFMTPIVSAGVLVGLKESITFPIRNTNEGMPVPVIHADAHPTIIKTLSYFVAKV